MKKDSFNRIRSNKPVSGSIRFVCSFSGEKLKLIKKQRVVMISPPDEIIPDKIHLSGSWIELLGADRQILYQRIIHDPLDEHVEVLTGKNDEPFTWKKASGLERTVVFLVPDLPGADQLVVLSNKPGEKKSEPLQVASFSLK